MSEIFSMLANVQNGGGLLIVTVWVLFKVTVIEHDFKTHIDFYHPTEGKKK